MISLSIPSVKLTSTVIADDGTVLVNFTDGIDKLIMYTCYPFGYYSPTNQRYVVQAVLQA